MGPIFEKGDTTFESDPNVGPKERPVRSSKNTGKKPTGKPTKRGPSNAVYKARIEEARKKEVIRVEKIEKQVQESEEELEGYDDPLEPPDSNADTIPGDSTGSDHQDNLVADFDAALDYHEKEGEGSESQASQEDLIALLRDLEPSSEPEVSETPETSEVSENLLDSSSLAGPSPELVSEISEETSEKVEKAPKKTMFAEGFGVPNAPSKEEKKNSDRVKKILKKAPQEIPEVEITPSKPEVLHPEQKAPEKDEEDEKDEKEIVETPVETLEPEFPPDPELEELRRAQELEDQQENVIVENPDGSLDVKDPLLEGNSGDQDVPEAGYVKPVRELAPISEESSFDNQGYSFAAIPENPEVSEVKPETKPEVEPEVKPEIKPDLAVLAEIPAEESEKSDPSDLEDVQKPSDFDDLDSIMASIKPKPKT